MFELVKAQEVTFALQINTMHKQTPSQTHYSMKTTHLTNLSNVQQVHAGRIIDTLHLIEQVMVASPALHVSHVQIEGLGLARQLSLAYGGHEYQIRV
jgi:hypothetical protein